MIQKPFFEQLHLLFMLLLDPNVIETLLDNAHPATRRRGDVVTTSLCTSQ